MRPIECLRLALVGLSLAACACLCCVLSHQAPCLPDRAKTASGAARNLHNRLAASSRHAAVQRDNADATRAGRWW